jgi:hypothetical protein
MDIVDKCNLSKIEVLYEMSQRTDDYNIHQRRVNRLTLAIAEFLLNIEKEEKDGMSSLRSS